jgi:hypothetical protein
MKPEKGKMVSIILEKLGSPKKGFPKESMEGEEDDHSMALHDSMKTFIESVASKDVESAVSSLKDFIYMCSEE